MYHVKGHGLSLVLGVAITLALLATACTSNDSFEGTEITSRDPAPDFRLTDQFGLPVTLDEISGEVVALTFLYTHCPDTCPLATQTLRQAYDALGDYATRVKFVAISVDPARDTPERTHAYSVQWDMADKWIFLTGREEDMEPVWRSYYVAVHQQEPQNDKSAQEHLIGHSAPVYLMDRDRKMRIVFTSLTLDPGPLVRDIRRLLE